MFSRDFLRSAVARVMTPVFAAVKHALSSSLHDVFVYGAILAAAGVVVYKKYVNIGIAVDTDRGLLVPVVKGADEKKP